MRGRKRWDQGTTLVECVVAIAVLGLSVGAVMLVNSQQLRLVRATREVGSGDFSLQERVEQMRIATWRQITDATYLRDTFFAARPASADPIGAITEEITVVGTIASNPTWTELKVRRNSNGSGQSQENAVVLRSKAEKRWSGRKRSWSGK